MICITAVRSQADEAIEPSTGQHPAGFSDHFSWIKINPIQEKKRIQLKSFWLFARYFFLGGGSN